MKHTISVTVDNKPGVLARVSNLFRRRGFNIDSLAVAPTDDARYSRMTIVVDAEDRPLEQVTKQLYKLINVVKITELPPDESVARELVLIKVATDGESRARVVEIADIFRSKIVDVSHDTITIEATGTQEKLEAILELLEPFGVREVARTGKVALARGLASE